MRTRRSFVRELPLIIIAVATLLGVPHAVRADKEMSGNSCIEEGSARARNLRDQTGTSFPFPGASQPVE